MGTVIKFDWRCVAPLPITEIGFTFEAAAADVLDEVLAAPPLLLLLLLLAVLPFVPYEAVSSYVLRSSRVLLSFTKAAVAAWMAAALGSADVAAGTLGTAEVDAAELEEDAAAALTCLCWM